MLKTLTSPSQPEPPCCEPDLPGESPAYLREQIITYIGNKRSLLPFIGRALAQVKLSTGKQKLRMLDLFSGSGVVARYMKQHAEYVAANDLETYSRLTSECYLENASAVNLANLQAHLITLERQITDQWAAGFITNLYAPQDDAAIGPDERVFYTRRNAMYLDTARQAIATLPAPMQRFFLAPLLADASVHTNTSGVFKGFYKANGVGQFGGNGKNALCRILGEIKLALPVFSRFECDYQVFQQDANQLVQELPEVDVAYLDPPYNQHPYGSNYFMLNLLVDYIPPKHASRVSGIPKDWKRSRYNQRREAAMALFDVVEKCRAKYILISYNSEGFISRESFLHHLRKCGTVTVLETPYNTFRGSRNLRGRAIHVTEFLYLLKK